MSMAPESVFTDEEPDSILPDKFTRAQNYFNQFPAPTPEQDGREAISTLEKEFGITLPPFARRVLNPQTPVLLTGPDEEALFESMKAMTMGTDNEELLIPTVRLREDGSFVRLDPDAAFKEAIASGDYIGFPNLEDADKFDKRLHELLPENLKREIRQIK